MPRQRTAHHAGLERRLVLLAWLNDLFGYRSNRDLLRDMQETEEGFDASGRSHVWHRLTARGYRVKAPAADLARYDENIREHLRAVNARRPEPITLRYFQHLALLHTELFLDRYFHHRRETVRSLNEFVRRWNAIGAGPGPRAAGDQREPHRRALLQVAARRRTREERSQRRRMDWPWHNKW